MKKFQIVCLVSIVSALLLLSACGSSSPIKDPLNYQVQSFRYTNQDNQTVSLEDLKGEVWVANFIFTNCETVCPPMTAHMSELQNMIEAEGLNAKIISFSVDPENDTPDKLREFASPYPLSFESWSFLTGYKQSEIEEFARESFKAIVQKPSSDDQVIHVTSFYLVDQKGTVMKSYSGVSDPPYEEIITDIKALED